MNELEKSESVSVSRREFCRKAIKRSSVAAAVGVAGYLAYRKPAVRSSLAQAMPMRRIQGMTSYQALLRELLSEKVYEEKRRLNLFEQRQN